MYNEHNSKPLVNLRQVDIPLKSIDQTIVCVCVCLDWFGFMAYQLL